MSRNFNTKDIPLQLYSETCNERPPHKPTESVLMRQVVFHHRYKCIEMEGHVTATVVSHCCIAELRIIRWCLEIQVVKELQHKRYPSKVEYWRAYCIFSCHLQMHNWHILWVHKRKYLKFVFIVIQIITERMLILRSSAWRKINRDGWTINNLVKYSVLDMRALFVWNVTKGIHKRVIKIWWTTSL